MDNSKESLSAQEMQKNERRFLDLLQEVKRPGMDELVVWLKETDFFVAPASTRYHESYKGGLCEHSLVVFDKLEALARTYSSQRYKGELGEKMYEKVYQSLILTALLHDVCKANFYKPGTRNVKNEETGQWEKVATFTVEDQLPFGHGEKSVFLIERHVRLTVEEAMAVRWHMGPWGASQGEQQTIGQAFEKYSLAVLLHMADMSATYLKF